MDATGNLQGVSPAGGIIHGVSPAGGIFRGGIFGGRMLAVLGFVLLAGCADSDNSLEIAGSYTDGFGGTHEITETTWTWNSSVYDIVSYNNGDDSLVAQTAADGNFHLFEWMTVSTDLYFCLQVFGAANAADAQAADRADRSDPTAGGCGVPAYNFLWTMLEPQ